ncbi:MAG: hypothetical protein CVU05_05580 [Bacteroidetes bacterium HGW-Bacteroidetes-21]|nr:MAG: hypothetical protein CVU05_05580 [Bacteroidetes bacterium HGW-Bacteroidetes-21]
MKQIYYFSTICVFFILQLNANAQLSNFKQGPQPDIYNTKSKSFEGLIKFIQITPEDTLYYTYYIKDRMVRMDAFESKNFNEQAESYMLFYLDQKMIYAFKPSRKMFVNVPPKSFIPTNDDNFRIIKSNNSKKINGYRCYQWRVRNKNQNTEVSYWVANDNFDFFDDFLKLWNRSEKHAAYFLKVPENKGFFPLVSEERTTLREEKMTLKVVEIKKQTLNRTLFEIPADFKNYEH